VKLVTDTNILVRCSQGRAAERARTLRQAGVGLVTTERNAQELVGVLQGVFGFTERDALIETTRILAPFEVIDSDDYGHARKAASRRLQKHCQGDWPALAAAMTLDAAIWSEDSDYFGVGVAVWSTRNVMIAAEAA
jgi:predicted nucleic acid-binding protein